MSGMKTIREQAGITQAALAAFLGLTQGAIAHYENGRRTPSLSECRRIVNALNELGAKCNLENAFPDPASAAPKTRAMEGCQ